MRPSRWAVPPRVRYFHHKSAGGATPVARRRQSTGSWDGRRRTRAGPGWQRGSSRCLGRSTRASIRCTNGTASADGSAEAGLVPVSVPLPSCRSSPTAFGCVAGLACRAPGHGGAVGAQLIKSGCIRVAHAAYWSWPLSLCTWTRTLPEVPQRGRGSRTPGTRSRSACRQPG
jgi:hypothetical protein